MKSEILRRQKKVSELFDKLKETNGWKDQRMIMLEIHQELINQNNELWDENVELTLKLKSLLQN